MFLSIAVVLGILWLMGLLVINIASPLFHLLLVVAVIFFVYDFVVRRRNV
ncbi:MAG: lmo0937 family membrane protein [Candidatus Saccharibacteria bacterium]|nr:lmo0937 family membrane protein [Candidatus Saccharibacteria bacterium]